MYLDETINKLYVKIRLKTHILFQFQEQNPVTVTYTHLYYFIEP